MHGGAVFTDCVESPMTCTGMITMTNALTVQYDRVMYLPDDTPQDRKLVHRYIDVWEYRTDASRSVLTGNRCRTASMTG